MGQNVHVKEVDRLFYKEVLQDRLPDKIFDIHVHLNLPEHVGPVSKERIKGDWAFETGLLLTCEEAYDNAAKIFPNISYAIAGFPWPIKEVDFEANNRYLLEKKAEGKICPLMGTRPEWDSEYMEKWLPEFVGYKPYPDTVCTVKGADISIYQFLPHHQLEVLNRHKKMVVVHLPRKMRIADPDNIKELLTMRQKYPEIKIVIAHLGRSFCPYYLETAIKEMGSDIEGFYFDTAAVLNPDTYRVAFQKLDSKKVLYGTDAPIMYWHGKRCWNQYDYFNLCEEDYSWNKHIEGRAKESNYTLFLYEQARAILDVMEEIGLDDEAKQNVFFQNSIDLLQNCGAALKTAGKMY